MCEKEPTERYSDAECQTLFASLFPAGFAGKDVLKEIAPEGWPHSTLQFLFHPTLEQVHWERVQLHRNLRNWPWFPKDRLEEPEPTLESIHADYQDSPVDTTREVRELVAMCLWDVFSNENDVVDRDVRLVDIGSWRGAAGFLADQLNRETGEQQYDYIDFYMGSFWVSERADLTPVYEMIFRRLKVQSLDWRYRFPELHLIEFPSERPNGRRSYELEKMRADLEQAHHEAMDDLKLESVPAIVLAYSNIYGVFPHGWPPWEFNERDD
ncbi:MAG: hypothetical protein DMG56_24595 [Acidobacteria bacterium]|nr:MAG: hypothetical protein DMG54_29685 [Acidobacteriota bacterium]PYU55947.1 MAG: hypothetical protein DMG56_24595 [Acidobacteriota bacterium]PYU68333.1 MAG: hypothetical protein DMG52_31850 [Acidobacteriota bacterium]